MVEEKIMQAIFRDDKNVLLSGPGGTGKTYLLNQIAKLARMKHRRTALTSTTGVSAINLTRGRTFHSFAGLGVAQISNEKLLGRIQSNQKASRRIIKTRLLIIDEISMLGKKLLETADYIFREIRAEPDLPFGGMQVVFSGDFLQLPPVKDSWGFNSAVWSEFNFFPFTLKVGWRYDDENFFDFMMRIRLGERNEEDMELIKSRVLAYRELEREMDKKREEGVIDYIMPTMLYPHRKSTACHNEEEMRELPGDEFVYKSEDGIIKGNKKELDRLKVALEDSIQEELRLKVGAQVMLKWNLDFNEELINGSRGVVKELFPNSVMVKFLPKKGCTEERNIMIDKKVWDVETDELKFFRSQIPLKLAFASTIHSIQGCTLDYACMDLSRSIFAPGQAYVALSRVRRLDGLFVMNFAKKSIMVDMEAQKYCKQINVSEEEREGFIFEE